MKKKPNIMYILADDMGYGDVSANNENCPFTTPNFDSIAKNGIRFTDAHATSAVCSPSRYSILTGRYNWRSKLKSNVLGGYATHLIESGRETVASVLKKQGYATHCFGKWHVGMDFACLPNFKELPNYAASEGLDYRGPIQNTPIDCGFDSFFGISASLDMPPYCYIQDNHFTAAPDHITKGEGLGFFREGPTAPDFVHSEVLDTLTNKVLQQIEADKDKPFFIYFPMPAPHTPILPAKQFRGKSHTNAYGDFVLHCDDVVGRVIQKLKDLDLYENTLLVYTSDNGCSAAADYDALLAHGHNPSYIFKGKKSDIWEGGHRIPLLIQWPTSIKGNLVSDSTVCLSDFMRTLADYFHVSLPDNAGEDSVSMLPLLSGETDKEIRSDTIHQSFDGSLSIRKGKWKLEMCPGSGGWGTHPFNDTPEVDGLPRYQLYDLENDIREQHNVYEREPEVFEDLKQLLLKRVKEGRSTPGTPQKNDGVAIWHAVEWMEKEINL